MLGLRSIFVRAKFRIGEAAYYGCTQDGGVLERSADINIFELRCLKHKVRNAFNKFH